MEHISSILKAVLLCAFAKSKLKVRCLRGARNLSMENPVCQECLLRVEKYLGEYEEAANA
ncbi:hypothetical protein CTH_2284 [Carboxydocella thermautotrophica]|nr:hypothetical protein CTH_2284 [Carboxydocella thermautotrophica]